MLKSGTVSRMILALGNLTYSSYLLHFPVQLTILLILDRLGIDKNIYMNPLSLPAFIIGIFALSHVIYVFFDRPMQNRLRVQLIPARPPIDNCQMATEYQKL
jgi:peptidoglycan/LPS O-acetylase OafA/YrhL